MVWCWQQEEKDRPSASEIIGVAEADQFLRLADAIRINNFGSQVYSTVDSVHVLYNSVHVLYNSVHVYTVYSVLG